jgi:hypothetical protein
VRGLALEDLFGIFQTVSKQVSIVQSNYIPWPGYFDLINSVDEFILFDDVQYTRRDWRNRNKIKSPQGPTWLTIPVHVKGKYDQKICETKVSDSTWPQRHWRSIKNFYTRAPFFNTYKAFFEELYLGCEEEDLSQINFRFLSALCDLLGITTCLSWSSHYELPAGRTERLVALCQQAGATDYLSGPAAQSYLDEVQFATAGISVEWMDYSGYPEYQQLFPPFESALSIVDLILNTGPEAWRYLKSFPTRGSTDPHPRSSPVHNIPLEGQKA